MSHIALLEKLGLPEFAPLPPFRSGWAQTIAGHFWPTAQDERPDANHVLTLDDGDKLSLLEYRPPTWKPGDRIALLVHGLAGSASSPYVARLSRLLRAAGVLVMRLNLRGCGDGFGLARLPYHSGRSEDARSALRWLAERFKSSPVTQVGYSLGANLTLKMAGEAGSAPLGNLDSIVAVSPPLDLGASTRHLQSSAGNRIFDWYFVQLLLRDVERHHRKFTELERPRLSRLMTLRDFDDRYTAPRGGFSGADDYYAKCSSGQFVPEIKVRTLILCSDDDPIVDSAPIQSLPKMPNLELVRTRHGGHVGFLGREGSATGVQWMDALIAQWVRSLQSPRPPGA